MVVTVGQQYNVGEKPTVISILYTSYTVFSDFLKKNQNAPRPSEHCCCILHINRSGPQPYPVIYVVANPVRGLRVPDDGTVTFYRN